MARPFVFIARVFPPSAGGGVQRPLKLAKHLAALGWNARVIAGKPVGEQDPSLLEELPPEVSVHRARISIADGSRRFLRALRLGRLHRQAVDGLLLGDEGFGDLAETVAVAVAAGQGAQAVLATSHPFSSVVAGAIAARMLSVPLIADLRDPWALAPRARFPEALRAVATELEARTLAQAVEVTIVSPSMRELLPPSAAIRATVAPNGFDPADFEGPAEPKDPGVFRVVYAGTLYGARRPEPVLAALRAVEAEVLASGRRLEILVAGAAHEHTETLRASGLPLTLCGYLPHQKATALLRSADALLVLVGVELADRHAPSGKLYEAIAAGPPVIAWARTDGEAARVLYETGTGVAAEDEAGLSLALSAAIRGELRVVPLAARELRAYDRRTTAAIIAALLERHAVARP